MASGRVPNTVNMFTREGLGDDFMIATFIHMVFGNLAGNLSAKLLPVT